jgi:DNA-binding phage protein
MDRAQLSRLFSESAAAANPTIQTLERVAAAFGKRVVLSLQDV